MTSCQGACRVQHTSFSAVVAMTALTTAACAGDRADAPADLDSLTPPVAAVIPEELETHGHVRVDDYYWLNDRDDPDVIAYLEAENEYTGAVMAHTAALREKLFNEIKGRIKQTDLSVPVFENGYFYYSRTEDGLDYPIRARKKGSLDAPEEIMLDENARAQGHGFYATASVAVSPATTCSPSPRT